MIGMSIDAQTVLTDKNFSDSQEGVTVVEFWARMELSK